MRTRRADHGPRPRRQGDGSPIREDYLAVYGDQGDASDEKKRAAEDAGVLWAVKEKAKPGRKLAKRQQARNRRFGKVRAKVEHVFRVMKCQFGYRKVRYRGIAKNGAQVFSLPGLATLVSRPRPICVRKKENGANRLRDPATHPEKRRIRHSNLRPEMTRQLLFRATRNLARS